MLLKDKIAIVTGGGSGIGEASSFRFAREGAAVIVADMRLRKAEAVAAQINEEGGHATAIEVDVSISESVEFKTFFTPFNVIPLSFNKYFILFKMIIEFSS